ncbi:leucine zipper putative tumor suppressor 2 homolog isoform X2 [Watersipora subatra]|uniref:leucine zipper putative tumor suppressor 2 homolog isoform X2 n=1 Tax=Watersipora subatra TaxID=2589382 RepID=UPI00355C56A4
MSDRGRWASVNSPHWYRKNSNRIVVRPIAFRPVMPGKRHESSSPESASFTPISYDEGYSSYDPSSGACSNSASTMSKDSDIVYASPIQISIRKDLETHDECPMIVNGDFDRLLQEKEAEILKLRRTMELNENAIVRVHEHKRVEWETQMKDLAEEYHRRLRAQQDTKHDRESDLRQIIVQLEIDNRQLAINVQQNKIDQDRQEHLSAQLAELKQRNTELNNRLTRELCECDRLRQQNKDLDIQIRKLQEQQSLGTREQDRLVKTINELEDQKCEADRENSLTIGQLQQQIKKQELQLADDKEKFKGEKRKWQDEKEKVMQYQKQLQRTYAQMYKRNHELEQQLCRINARRLARLETQSLQMQMDRHSLLEVDLESCPESFC